MKIHHSQDFYSALLFLAFGVGFFYFGLEYDIGNARRMGPAYFPIILSSIQILLGLMTLGLSLWPGNPQTEETIPTNWRGILLVLGSVMLFAQLLPVAGFLVAGPLLILMSSLANSESSIKERLILAVVLPIFCILVFRIGLEMQFPVLPPALAL